MRRIALMSASVKVAFNYYALLFTNDNRPRVIMLCTAVAGLGRP